MSLVGGLFCCTARNKAWLTNPVVIFLSHRITHYFTGKYILETSQIELPALDDGYIGDIPRLDFTGYSGQKDLTKEILCDWQGMGRIGCRLEFALLLAR